MTAPRKIVLVVGSPKGKASASYAMAVFFGRLLVAHGAETETVCVRNISWMPQESQAFFKAMDDADSAFFFFPLYADQIPGIMVEALERYATHRASFQTTRLKSIAGLCNSGFPEARQNDGAMAVLRRFAELQSLEFLGGLTLGGGGMIRGDLPLERQGGKTFGLRKALQIAAEAFAQGKPLPKEAVALVRRPVIPHTFYAWIAEAGFRWHCWKRKLQAKAKPYEESPQG
jgi:hypothetical protein